MTTIQLPKMGLSMEEATIRNLLVEPGQRCLKGEALLEIETDKSVVEVEMPQDGTIAEWLVAVGETIAVGAPVVRLAGMDEADGQRDVPAVTMYAEDADQRFIRISPAARRRAGELQVSYQSLQGSGPGGRIIHRDIEEAAYKRQTETARAQTPETAASIGPGRKLALTGMRRAIAKRMTTSAATIPQFYVKRKVDISQLLEIKRTVQKSVQRSRSVKLSFNDFLIRAVAEALRACPQLNASFIGTPEQADSHILQHEHINIGLAVAAEDGLFVPVIHRADELSVVDIAAARKLRIAAVRGQKETSEYLQGGTFTISNLGTAGVEEFTAIVNPPEAGILAVGAAVDELKLIEGKLETKRMVALTGSFDHRVIDGVTAAAFMESVVKQMQSEEWLLF